MISPDPPLPNSYWVYPGQLLAGEYPGSPRSDSSRSRLQRLLTAGINFFVDLTMVDELPPYAQELPPSVQHNRLPIFDHDVPMKPEQMVEILRTIKGALNANKRVYVHCRAGIGRTGTVVGCLLSDSGVSGDDALYELNRMWQQCARSRSWTAVPETDEQIDYVRQWNRLLYPAVLKEAQPPPGSRMRSGGAPGAWGAAKTPTLGAPPQADPSLSGGRSAGAPLPSGARGPVSASITSPRADPPSYGGRSSIASPASASATPPQVDPSLSKGRGSRSKASPQPSRDRGALFNPAPASIAPLQADLPAMVADRERAGVILPPIGPEQSASALYTHAPGLVQSPAQTTRERYLGALIGLAVGDALGAIHQQQPRGSFEPITDLVEGGVLNLPRGAWTDDTAMALCLAESLLESRGFDARDQVERYARWQQNGYMSATDEAVGITPNTARSIAMAQWRRQLFAGSHDPKLVEPSPLSRMGPPVMFYLLFKQQALEFAGDAVRTTCQAPMVLNVCRLFAAMLHGALEGLPKPQVLAPPWDLPADRPKSRIRGLIEGRYRAKDPASIRAGDHVIDTLELALWAFERTDSFADGALLVANAGENSDVAGAVYGQLAGAYYGVEAIPAAWRNSLIKKDLVESLALRLLDQTKVGAAG